VSVVHFPETPDTASRISPGRSRTLADVALLILADDAETSIAAMLDRIPRTVAEHLGAVVVSDDASVAATADVANRWAVAHPHVNVQVLRQSRPLGVGGSQKHCCEFALDIGCSIVVVIDTARHCAPELIAAMVSPLLQGSAHVVIGRRAGRAESFRVDARPGGGRRTLAVARSWCEGLRVADWHSGYRAYDLTKLDMSAVSRLADGADFDTEIVLAAWRWRRRIVEVDIPPLYAVQGRGKAARYSAMSMPSA